MSENLGDLVVTAVDLHKDNGAIIPMGTLGVICGRTGAGLVQVDFGRHYGIKFVSPVILDPIGRVAEPEDLGSTLIDMVLKLSEETRDQSLEITRLRGILAKQERLSPSRLVINGGSTHHRADIGDGSR